MPIHYRDYPILYVDDEQQNLVAFRYAMEERFRIITASSGEEALRILQDEDIAVVMADQRMPGMTGVDICSKAKELRPNAVRIIVTAYSDLQAAIDAINKGHVLRYLTKPWRIDEVTEVLRTSIELINLQRTVRDMEMRLLQGGPTNTVVAVQQELAHEFNNPLTSLLMNSQMVSDLLISAIATVDTDNKQHLKNLLVAAQEGHQDAIAAIAQLRSMVGRLKQGRRPTATGTAATCDAARVVDSTARILRREIEKSARMQVILEGSPTINMEASALGQVMLNLLINAAQAIGESNPEGNVITIRVKEEAQEAKITVSDTGPGIPAEHIGRVFDPYFTTKTGNTGIGLAVVQELTKQAGGRVAVESQLGKGATFIITLPRVLSTEIAE
jgi:two-component system NtrC family sensor kinase